MTSTAATSSIRGLGPEAATVYGVMFILTMNMFAGCRVAKANVGAKPKAAIQSELRNFISS
ncbi:hypothetical protein ACFWNE_00665 [Streptomyces goshikiensis]|uniref:hypothetical protein n=1 Tax=Streptomyces goshikiensis TaxID=1942 RepID=UPI00364BF4CC